MSRAPRSPAAPQLAAFTELLASTDAAAAETLAERAARHFERARRPVVRAKNTSAPAAKASPAPRTYLHRVPTRSAVMNAFLHGVGELGVVPPDASIPEEHRLAPRLVERARRYWPKMLLAIGDVPSMIAVAEQTAPIENEEAARFLMRRAMGAHGALAEIARDYGARRRELGPEAPDDRLAACIMAAFAGTMIAHARKLLGGHVRDDLRTELRALYTTPNAPARQRPARALETPPDARVAQPSLRRKA